VETPHQPQRPHQPTVWSFIQESLILLCIRASTISERDVICWEIEQLLLREVNVLTMDPACSLVTFYRVDAARSIADDARKSHAILMLGGHRFGYSLSCHRNARTGLPITTILSCYIRQLLYHLAFNSVNNKQQQKKQNIHPMLRTATAEQLHCFIKIGASFLAIRPDNKPKDAIFVCLCNCKICLVLAGRKNTAISHKSHRTELSF